MNWIQLQKISAQAEKLVQKWLGKGEQQTQGYLSQQTFTF
jgi:hypothetical protein